MNCRFHVGHMLVVHVSVDAQAHLKAQSFYSVVANIRGRSAEEVAGPLLDSQELRGLQVHS